MDERLLGVINEAVECLLEIAGAELIADFARR